MREHIARPQDLPPSAPQQPPPVFTDPDGVASYDIDQIIAHELKRGGVTYQIRWKGYDPADDTWETERSLLTQEGGRVAVAQYRARRLIVEALPAYKQRSRNGRNAPLPKLPFATASRVAESLRAYELALNACDP